MENFGWMGIMCSCKTAFKHPMEHGFGINNEYSPMAIYTFDCPKCGKIYNLKVDIWEAK